MNALVSERGSWWTGLPQPVRDAVMNGRIRVECHGYASTLGPPRIRNIRDAQRRQDERAVYNRQLSARRASNVREFLMNSSVIGQHADVRVHPHGEDHAPPSENVDGGVPNPAQQRVEVLIVDERAETPPRPDMTF
jgi:hypothetical protein